jgi:tetratricopeptide (TPR) repeat protein
MAARRPCRTAGNEIVVESGELLPTGFRGPVRTWNLLLPAAERTLRLPRDRARLQLGGHCEAAAGSSLQFESIEVQAFTESMGRFEDAVRALAERLEPDGLLLLDVENLQSVRMLHLVLEGHPGSFEPCVSPDDPSLALPLRRALAAATAAGLWVEDVVRVPTPPQDVGPGFASVVFREGFLPLQWLEGAPPGRFWLVCRKSPSLVGSVVIGGRDEVAAARSEARVREFLPAGWEVVRAAAAVPEPTGWNRAVAAARGDHVWFLRAGAEPDRELFAALVAAAIAGPAAPGQSGVRACPGDVSGLLVARSDVQLAGPLRESLANTRVALEDWLLRLDTVAPAAELVPAAFTSPAVPVEAPALFAAETAALVQRWEPLGQGKLRHDSEDDPRARARTDRITPWAGREPRISLCMIARDEQRFLPECLARARDAFDELVLVDTGSLDRTVAIAESFGARIVHRAWDDDFAAARNAGLSVATGDWILVLDADEMLQDGAAARIRELVRDAGVSGYHLRFTNSYTSGKTVSVLMVRLFRRLPGVAWQNVIHEQVTPSLVRAGNAAGLILSTADVEVLHHGYTDEVMAERGKNERNERLFQKQLAANPDDVYSLYKYGDFLRRLPDRAGEARELLERCFQLILAGPPHLPRELPFAGEVAALAALELGRAGQVARAREIVDIALRRFLPTPNLHYIAASLDLTAGRNDEAIAHFQRCFAYRGQTLVVPIQEGITGHVALAGIAQACLQKGDHARARRLLEQAIAAQPAWEASHLALSRLHFEQREPVAALHALTRFLAAHPASPGACQQATMILHRLGLEDHARRMGAQAVRLFRAGARDLEAAQMERILAAI